MHQISTVIATLRLERAIIEAELYEAEIKESWPTREPKGEGQELIEDGEQLAAAVELARKARVSVSERWKNWFFTCKQNGEDLQPRGGLLEVAYENQWLTR